ncbi:hypothetical protein IPG41_02005 [Candidatus Peregrinibacteria bacterium]|nr:MAG: hypothetical protein IPG41_02005 [Candidatus Peregrinibacteria bacterium]
MSHPKLISGFLFFLILPACSQAYEQEMVEPYEEEVKEDYELRGRVNEEGLFVNQEGESIVNVEGLSFTLPEGWNAVEAYIGGADIELQNQKEGSIMDLAVEGNLEITDDDEERLIALPELTSGKWFELPCGLGAWCYYVNIRESTYFLVFGLDYVEAWDQFEKDLYSFFNSMEVSAYDSSDNQLNTEVFDLGFSTLEEYFLLTEVIQYESEYSAGGNITNNLAPEGYVLIRNEEGEPKRFYLENSDREVNFISIYAEEGYESKEAATFYLNRMAGPRVELYGPFSANLASLLK